MICLAGTYGSTTALTDANCSGLCHAGYFCPEGSLSPNLNKCAAGRYGNQGSVDSACSGPCEKGYYCTEGSDSSQENQCGAANRYCPLGTTESRPVRIILLYYIVLYISCYKSSNSFFISIINIFYVLYYVYIIYLYSCLYYSKYKLDIMVTAAKIITY